MEFATAKVGDTFEPGNTTMFGSETESALAFVEQKRYSTLERIGYTPQMIDTFTGKLRVKTKWTPHPQSGKPVYGQSKEWSAVEWWVYNEWFQDGKRIVLSPNQIRWAESWADINCLEFDITGGRDSGKSWFGSIASLYSMVFHNDYFKGYMVSLFAGAKSQTGTVYEEHIIPLIAKSQNIHKLVSDYDPLWDIIAKRKKAAVKEIELKLMNGARLIVNPASPKAARSKHPDLLWIDEAVEAETNNKGSVITGAVASLTAGHHMRILATSTVHKLPNGWFATKVRRAKRLMQQGRKDVFYCNLSEGGLGSKSWLTIEEHKKEMAVKAADTGIDLASEFYGEIVGGSGDAFLQDLLAKSFELSKSAKYNPDWYLIAGHDPGFGSSYYGFTLVQTDFWNVQVLYSNFWWKKSPNYILNDIDDIISRNGWRVDLHSVDIYGTGTIKMLQDQGYEVVSYAFNHKPQNWDDMLPDDQERFKAPQKYIAINEINDWLSQDRFRCYELDGEYKAYDRAEDAEKVYANQILQEQMLSARIDPKTNKLIKGGDDMLDSLLFTALPIALGDTKGGRVVGAGNLT